MLSGLDGVRPIGREFARGHDSLVKSNVSSVWKILTAIFGFLIMLPFLIAGVVDYDDPESFFYMLKQRTDPDSYPESMRQLMEGDNATKRYVLNMLDLSAKWINAMSDTTIDLKPLTGSLLNEVVLLTLMSNKIKTEFENGIASLTEVLANNFSTSARMTIDTAERDFSDSIANLQSMMSAIGDNTEASSRRLVEDMQRIRDESVNRMTETCAEASSTIQSVGNAVQDSIERQLSLVEASITRLESLRTETDALIRSADQTYAKTTAVHDLVSRTHALSETLVSSVQASYVKWAEMALNAANREWNVSEKISEHRQQEKELLDQLATTKLFVDEIRSQIVMLTEASDKLHACTVTYQSCLPNVEYTRQLLDKMSSVSNAKQITGMIADVATSLEQVSNVLTKKEFL